MDTLKQWSVQNKQEEEKIASFRYGRRLLKKMGEKYPKTLPFSHGVYRIHELLQKFINSAHRYIDYFYFFIWAAISLLK